jgi:hypothetical protein
MCRQRVRCGMVVCSDQHLVGHRQRCRFSAVTAQCATTQKDRRFERLRSPALAAA